MQKKEIQGINILENIEILYRQLIKEINNDFEFYKQNTDEQEKQTTRKYLNLYFWNKDIKKLLIQDLKFILTFSLSEKELKLILLLLNISYFSSKYKYIMNEDYIYTFEELKFKFVDLETDEIKKENDWKIFKKKFFCESRYKAGFNILQTILDEERKNFLLLNLDLDQILSKEYFQDVNLALKLIRCGDLYINQVCEEQIQILNKLFNNGVLKFTNQKTNKLKNYFSRQRDYKDSYYIILYYSFHEDNPSLLSYLVTRQINDLLEEALTDMNLKTIDEDFAWQFIFKFLPKITYLEKKIVHSLQMNPDFCQDNKLIVKLLLPFVELQTYIANNIDSYQLEEYNRKILNNEITLLEIKRVKILLTEKLELISIHQLNEMIQAIIRQAKELQKMRSDAVDISKIIPDKTPNLSTQQINYSI